MATIQRPGKEGNATTYQGKVAAGYSNILAQEVDADIDAIYSAWNQGVDTVNIKDASVTAAKLAPGAVTATALAPGSIPTAALADGAITSAKILDGTITSADIANGTITGADIANATIVDANIANVAWTKLVAPLLGNLPLTPRAAFQAGPSIIDWHANNAADPLYDNTKPSWIVRLDYGNDAFQIYRAPPPGSSFVPLFGMANDGHLTTPILRASLGVNAVNGAPVFVACPAGFGISTTGWNTLATLPITTRGGYVHLWAAANGSVIGPGATGGYVWARWLCDGASIVQDNHLVGTGAGVFIPVPNLCWMHNPAAGAHNYAYQVAIDINMSFTTAAQSGGGFIAQEVG